MNTPGRNPLETLVVAELAELRQRELALHNCLQGEKDKAQTGDASSFQLELAQLRNHADRLGRMMDAMSSFFSAGVPETLATVPAL